MAIYHSTVHSHFPSARFMLHQYLTNSLTCSRNSEKSPYIFLCEGAIFPGGVGVRDVGPSARTFYYNPTDTNQRPRGNKSSRIPIATLQKVYFNLERTRVCVVDANDLCTTRLAKTSLLINLYFPNCVIVILIDNGDS